MQEKKNKNRDNIFFFHLSFDGFKIIQSCLLMGYHFLHKFDVRLTKINVKINLAN